MQPIVSRCIVAIALLQTAGGIEAQTPQLPPEASSPAIDAPTAAATLLSQAENAIARGDDTKALSLLNKASAGEPADSLENARILYDRGYAEQAQHQLTAAEADYRKASIIDPKQFESHAALGQLLAQQQQWKEARHELERAVTLHPAGGDSQHAVAGVERTLAHVDAEMRDTAAASDALLAAIKSTSEQTDDTFLAAQLAEEQGNYPGAEQEYRKILAADPTSVPAAEGLGRALTHEGKFAEAESSLHSALLLEPNDPTLLAESATALAGQGNSKAAITQMETLHQQDPNQPAVTRMLADLYSSAGEAAMAEPLYQKLLVADPHNPDLLTAAGENFLREKKWMPAAQAFQESLNIAPAQADAWSGLAFAASQDGQYSMVLTALEHRTQYLRDNPATLFLRATALDHLHRTREAIRYYRAFLADAQDRYPDERQETRQRLKALRK